MIHVCSAHVFPELLAGKVVLIVEPQVPIALQQRSVALELGASEVLACASVGDGLATIESGVKPDLAIVDFGAGEVSTLIARLDAAGIALVITSVADPVDQADAPAFVRITKPYLETELVKAIAAAMARRRPGA